MKKIVLLIVIAVLGSCNKDDDHAALPAATTTGAGTFACKVNGKRFIDPGSSFNCFYQYYEGGYYFGINGKDEDYIGTNMPWSIWLLSENVNFEEGHTYQLLHEFNGNVVGNAVFAFSANNSYSQETSAQFTGELTITRFGTGMDPHIISGTFWFDVPHPLTGKVVHITDGRFDTMYLQ